MGVQLLCLIFIYFCESSPNSQSYTTILSKPEKTTLPFYINGTVSDNFRTIL